jgi:hypothetical protein
MKSVFLTLAACCILLPATYAGTSPATAGMSSGFSAIKTVSSPLPEAGIPAEEDAIHCRVELTNGVVVECWLCNCANLYASLVPQSPSPNLQP